MFLKRLLAALLILCVVAIAGCSTSDTANQTTTSTVAGHVYLEDHQVVDDIQFYTTSGHEISHVDQGTDEFGAFMCEVYNLPAEFEVRVTISDPTLTPAENTGSDTAGLTALRNENPGTTQLRVFLKNFDSEDDFVDVNILTTLIYAYWEEHPDLTYEEADLAVKAFLVMPDDFDATCLWGCPDNYFDTETFLSEAEKEGGIENFIALLVREVDNGGTRSFAKLGSPNGVDDIDFTTSSIQIGQNICEDFVPGSGVVLGMVFTAMGVDFGGNSEMKVISEQLQKISEQIAHLGVKLQEMMRDYSNLGQYTTLTTAIKPRMNDIETWSGQMRSFTENAADGIKPDPANLLALKNAIYMNASYLKQLHDYQVGDPGLLQKGAMVFLQDIVASRFYCNSHHKILLTQFNTVQADLFRELNLLTSAYTGGASPQLDKALETYNIYWKYLKEEYSMLPYPLQSDEVILDRQHKLLWTRAPVHKLPANMSMFPLKGGFVLSPVARDFAARYSVGPYGPGSWRLPRRNEVESLQNWREMQKNGFCPGMTFTGKYVIIFDADYAFTGLWNIDLNIPDWVAVNEKVNVMLVSDLPQKGKYSELMLEKPTGESAKPENEVLSAKATELSQERNAYITRLTLLPGSAEGTGGAMANPGFYWTSSDETVATVSNEGSPGGLKPFTRGEPTEGIVTWKKANTPVTITASRLQFGKKISYSIELGSAHTPSTIPAPLLKAIAIYPKNKTYSGTFPLIPLKTQYYALGIYTDGTFKNLSKLVTWSTTGGNNVITENNEAYLIVNNSTGDAEQTITAVYQNASGSTKYKGKNW